ncbi:MAG: NAD-dependent epimerase/dehydratase family protein [Dehalococcoidia bacterium]|nr:NAD-dependent epimerase/dehydratase family protein [Dehalococcoidia bacterium]
MRVLVTGANGFVGSHIADRLQGQGVDIRLMLRRTSSIAFLGGVKDYERVEGDMRNAESLTAAVRGVGTVIHCAGLTNARTEAEYQAINGEGTAVLARAAAEAGVKRFVYVSSLAAQGPSPDGSTSIPDVAHPISSYGRSKLAGEYATLTEKERMSVAIVRPPVVYGERDHALLPFYRIASLGVLPVLGGGQNQVSFVHTHDCADAIIRAALTAGRSGGIYTIADGPPHTWRGLVQAFARARGRGVRIINTPPSLFMAAGYAGGAVSKLIRRALPLNPDEVAHMRERYWVCDYEAIARDLGWQPRISLDQGFAQMLRWYREQRWL